MFTEGQLIFTAIFVVAFVAVTIYVYRRDSRLHKVYYKGSYKILIGFLCFILFLFFIKGFLKH